MSLFMLHTDIAADLIQGRSPALDTRIASTVPQELCISAVTRGELLCGLSRQMLQKNRELKPEKTGARGDGRDQGQRCVRGTAAYDVW